MNLFQKTEFQHANRTVTSHNRVTKFYQGCTGMKTGYTMRSGFNIVSTAKRNGSDELIAVILGGESADIRDKSAVFMLELGFQIMEKLKTKNESEIAEAQKIRKLGQQSLIALTRNDSSTQLIRADFQQAGFKDFAGVR